MGVPVPAAYKLPNTAAPLNKTGLRLVNELETDDGLAGSILAPWVTKLARREQRAIMAALRGSDDVIRTDVKMITRAIRQVSQKLEDNQSKRYFGKYSIDEIADKLDYDNLVDECMTMHVHHFQHMMEALGIIQREKGDPFRKWYEFLMEEIIGPVWGYDPEGP